VRTLASICFSSMVGRWVDHSPNRLKTLLATISVNRFAVITASVLWFFIVQPNSAIPKDGPSFGGLPLQSIIKGGVFSLILILGILEGLSGSGNMLSMERDWVVTAAAPDGRPYDLTHLNSTMRRIDLICKLIAPILISIIISTTNTKIGVLVVGGMSAASWAAEILCARRVWNRNPRLKAPKVVRTQTTIDDSTGSSVQDGQPQNLFSGFSNGLGRYVQDFKNYFSSTVWTPSLALSLLHISALTYSGTFITYLLNVGFSLDLITFARAAGSVVEISSTAVTPVGVHYLSKAQNHGRFRGEERISDDSEMPLIERPYDDESRTETGLERLGLWGISWQLLNLVSMPSKNSTLGCSKLIVSQIPVVFALWSLSPSSIPESLRGLLARALFTAPKPVLAFILFFFLSISRLGLWIYDLTTQQLTQTMTLPSQRSSFTGVEYSFVSLFELAQYIVTMILHRPEQFKWIALMSWIAVAISTIAYAGWVWRMRGHLVHWEKLGKSCKCAEVRGGHEARSLGWTRRLGITPGSVSRG
jgi:iron-regulated transporter 1